MSTIGEVSSAAASAINSSEGDGLSWNQLNSRSPLLSYTFSQWAARPEIVMKPDPFHADPANTRPQALLHPFSVLALGAPA
jgi:hypothetical protein